MQQGGRRKAARTLETIEASLREQARKFVEERANRAPPMAALPSMLGLLGCGKLAPGCNLADPAVSQPVAERLRLALRRERAKARCGNAGYDFGRHLALHEMLGHLAKICPAISTMPKKASSHPG